MCGQLVEPIYPCLKLPSSTAERFVQYDRTDHRPVQALLDQTQDGRLLMTPTCARLYKSLKGALAMIAGMSSGGNVRSGDTSVIVEKGGLWTRREIVARAVIPHYDSEV